MFIGEYRNTIDAKRRLAIPAKFRKRIGETAVLTKSLDNSLVLYPMKEWEELAGKLSKLPVGQSGTRSFVRTMLAGAADVEIDALGRVLVPDYLKDYAGLKKNTVIAGLYNRLEIWDEATWDEYKKNSEKNTGEIAEKLGELGVY
ncbi:MAG: division/cell wall cluster transcriptional repressor MraZ [Candidatus Sungbacteria bacterium]|uniref:Transcriptional regulator MraZ n=1 Tax=Candidatus Sungiibacteriota bacterium TaxID=2750080 RepID=A0A9D6DR70_9BACT|nr:division/cell wall cluster transcriptional repressor MraZ [Candidatus Sungbacteria bacterium]